MDENKGQREMPRYKCHKEVHALKIAEIVMRGDGGAEVTPSEPGYAGIIVPPDYVKKHEPVAGGYYVVYADGYKSFSPAEAFEAGYIRAN